MDQNDGDDEHGIHNALNGVSLNWGKNCGWVTLAK